MYSSSITMNSVVFHSFFFCDDRALSDFKIILDDVVVDTPNPIDHLFGTVSTTFKYTIIIVC